MNQQTQSLIRHILTALGTLLALTGLDKVTGLVNYLLTNLDGLYAAIGTLTGVVVAIYGYFKNSDRFTTRT